MPLSHLTTPAVRRRARAKPGLSLGYLAQLQAITPRLRTMALRFLRDPQDVDDAVQDVLLAVHTTWHSYDPNQPFGRWVRGIAHDRLADHQRARARIRALEAPLASHDTPLSSGPSDHGDTRDSAMDCAIRALPPAERRALSLLKLDGLSLAEAALISGMSVPALKVASHRAVRRLTGMLRPRDAAA